MKILVITQDAPLYLPWFLDRFVGRAAAQGHRVFLTRLSPAAGGSMWREAKRRWAFYGPRAFATASCRILLHRLASKLPAALRGGRCFSLGRVIARHGVPEIPTRSVNDPAFVARVRAEGIDLVVSVAAPEIFRAEILAAPPRGCINYHTALLPRHRGRQPLFWAMLAGDAETGVTVHEMNAKLDDGPILCQKRVPISGTDTLHDLYLKTMSVGVDALLEAVGKIARGDRARMPNPAEGAVVHGFPGRAEAAAFRRAGRRFF